MFKKEFDTATKLSLSIRSFKIIKIKNFNFRNEFHKTRMHIFKQKNALTVCNMVSQCQITPDKLHIPNLTLAGIRKNMFIQPMIFISMEMPRMFCEYKNIRKIRTWRYPSLGRTTILPLELPAVVYLVGYEGGGQHLIDSVAK
ncbi:MAG: hypothetical protein IPG39_16475 [Bacteroidetes bacterium]|nr:hypothetical protein [Bacteroidota bacterium]